MTVSERSAPGIRERTGMWSRVISEHRFEPVMDRAEGIYIYDTDGNKYIDVSGGPIANNLGHGDQRVKEAMVRQLDRFAHSHPTFSHEPRARLCERIGQVAPGDLNTSVLVCGGSEAVETAIKLARQYHVERGKTGKSIVVSRWGSYHGMTLGALSVAGDQSRHKFAPMLLQWPHIPQPSDFDIPGGMTYKDYAIHCAQELERVVHYVGADNVAAFIATPIGASHDYGLMPPTEYWQTIRDICDRYDVLLIADEVVTGFGRTGKWFAMEHFGVQADIMTTAKGISSLYAPLGAVTASDRVNEPFGEGGAKFVHGFTYGGHPLSCAAGLAVIDILESDGLVENSAEVGAYLHSQRDRLLEHPTIGAVRGKGLLMVPEMVSDKETMKYFPPDVEADKMFISLALKNGLAMYPSLQGPRSPASYQRGIPMFISPPLRITREQVDEVMDRLDRTLTEWEQSLGVA